MTTSPSRQAPAERQPANRTALRAAATKPNFFIMGAPKCGTTSMYFYLLSHASVFMPEEKEPHYFATDLPIRRRMTTEGEYLSLFSPATATQRAVGEASTWYLFSREAARNIRAFDPDARLIAFFRNPVDFVQSLEAQEAWNLSQLPDFTGAWQQQDSRRMLVEAGLFGQQLERLLGVFPREQVLTILTDDLKANVREQYLRVLAFIGLEDNGLTDFQRYNENKVHRSPWLSNLIRRPLPPFVGGALRAVKRAAGIKSLGMTERLQKLNNTPAARPTLDPAVRAQVHEAFADDIGLLSSLLGRDLSHWR